MKCPGNSASPPFFTFHSISSLSVGDALPVYPEGGIPSSSSFLGVKLFCCHAKRGMKYSICVIQVVVRVTRRDDGDEKI